MNGYFLLFFVASRIPKISNATRVAKLIINSNVASIDKKNAPFVKVHRIHIGITCLSNSEPPSYNFHW
ncbi:hypothetical protein HMPREF2097_03181 [Enterococcus faecalis 918]|nr:hypothetical protein HMPREF2097_03181 [Enterococcus faecalis 918]